MNLNSEDTRDFILSGPGGVIKTQHISKQVKNIGQKECHLHKYTLFLSKNKDSPFWVKQRVLESALNSTVFFGCER